MEIRKTRYERTVFFAAALLAYVLIFIRNTEVAAGVRQGLAACAGTLIPSVFPMLFLSCFLAKTGLPAILRKAISFPLKRLAALPPAAAECFVFGSAGGYPAGVKIAVTDMESGKLTPLQAKRAALIHVNPGPAFAVLVAGKIFSGAVLRGALYYASVTAGNAALAFALKLLRKEKREKPPETVMRSAFHASAAFLESAREAADGMFSICAWVLLFYGFASPLTRVSFLQPFLFLFEVTRGVTQCSAANDYVKCVFAMGFGGLCIFFQLLPELAKLKIRCAEYLLCRAFAASAAAGFYSLLMRLFPTASLPASASPVAFRPYAGTAAGSAALLFACLVFLVSCLPPERKKSERSLRF